jgi:hypothetical protein
VSNPADVSNFDNYPPDQDIPPDEFRLAKRSGRNEDYVLTYFLNSVAGTRGSERAD